MIRFILYLFFVPAFICTWFSFVEIFRFRCPVTTTTTIGKTNYDAISTTTSGVQEMNHYDCSTSSNHDNSIILEQQQLYYDLFFSNPNEKRTETTITVFDTTKATTENHNSSSGFKMMDTTIMNNDTTSDYSMNHHCFPLNSPQWLEGPRIGNIRHEQMDDKFTQNMIQQSLYSLLHNHENDHDDTTQFSHQSITNLQQQQQQQTTILDYTICHPKSEFRNHRKTNVSTISLWTTRLIYLAIHTHQHRPAAKELDVMMNLHPTTCIKQQNKNEYHNVGPFDYECPDTKYLVVQLFKNGIGANMRLAAVPALIAGFITNRVVLFLSNTSTGPIFLQQPWSLSSCKRKDYQCFFLPITPCTITHTELNNAYVLQRKEMRHIFRSGQIIPMEHEKDRVLIMHLSFRPQRFPEFLHENLYNVSMGFIHDYHTSRIELNKDVDPSLISMLHAAAEGILKEEKDTTTPTVPSFNYYGEGSHVFHAFLLYALRPNHHAIQQMDDIMKAIVPLDFDPDHSIGLPIRASDKCGTESECLNFTQHIDAAKQLWLLQSYNNHHHHIDQHFSDFEFESLPQKVPYVIVTTESQEIKTEYESYLIAENRNNYVQVAYGTKTNTSKPFFHFITNHLDVTQNTGFMNNDSNENADDIMLSAMSSLKVQLMNKITLGNCCSNFHLLLKDILEEGCGAASASSSSNQDEKGSSIRFQCLQEHPDHQYRVCCAWDQSDRCKQRRSKNMTHSTIVT